MRPLEADRGTPLRPLNRPVSGTVDRGLPHRVVCLAAAQDRRETGGGTEACALAESWCLTACLTPTTAAQVDHRAGNTGI